jgi:hypothetical protein
MVAIAVLAIALTGPFVAVTNALNASYVARDQLVASALAQEGMEYIRSVRDNNYLNSRTWMDGLSGYACYGATPTMYCMIDPTRGDIHTDSPNDSAMNQYASLASVPPLNLSTNGLYNQQAVSGTNVATRFTRSVQLNAISATEVQVSVVVSWISAHQTYSVTVTDDLMDWI